MKSADHTLLSCCELLPPNAPEWLDFIQARPDSTLFHHPSWINLLSNYYHFHPFVLVFKDIHGCIAAGVPMMEIPGWRHQTKLVSLPFTDHCSPLYLEETNLIGLVDGILELYGQEAYRQIELRWPYPCRSVISPTQQYVLSKVTLAADTAVVSGRIKQKHFRNVRVSKDRGVTIRIGTGMAQLKDFYQLHWQSRRKHGVPVQPWKYFQFLHEQIILPGYGFLINAYFRPSGSEHPICIGASIFLAWNRTLIEKYSAVNEAGRKLFAMDLILWNAICWGCEQGMKVLDMGRTDLDNDGLRSFKKRWSAQEEPLLYSYLPQEQTLPHHNQFIPVLQNVIRSSPLWVCRLTGELFYPYFA